MDFSGKKFSIYGPGLTVIAPMRNDFPPAFSPRSGMRRGDVLASPVSIVEGSAEEEMLASYRPTPGLPSGMTAGDVMAMPLIGWSPSCAGNGECQLGIRSNDTIVNPIAFDGSTGIFSTFQGGENRFPRSPSFLNSQQQTSACVEAGSCFTLGTTIGMNPNDEIAKPATNDLLMPIASKKILNSIKSNSRSNSQVDLAGQLFGSQPLEESPPHTIDPRNFYWLLVYFWHHRILLYCDPFAFVYGFGWDYGGWFYSNETLIQNAIANAKISAENSCYAACSGQCYFSHSSENCKPGELECETIIANYVKTWMPTFNAAYALVKCWCNCHCA